MSTLIVFKKQHKILSYNKQVGFGASNLAFGFFGLKAIAFGILTKKQIEAVRKIIMRKTKKLGKLFIRVFFNFPLTKKPVLTRMGKGCGPIVDWICFIKKGTILFEINGISLKLGFKALKSAKIHLPIKTVFIKKCIFTGVTCYSA